MDDWQRARQLLTERGVTGADDLGRFVSNTEHLPPGRLDERAAMPVLLELLPAVPDAKPARAIVRSPAATVGPAGTFRAAAGGVRALGPAPTRRRGGSWAMPWRLLPAPPSCRTCSGWRLRRAQPRSRADTARRGWTQPEARRQRARPPPCRRIRG
jgi:hypothetical protein